MIAYLTGGCGSGNIACFLCIHGGLNYIELMQVENEQ
jgi:hypothetical protein